MKKISYLVISCAVILGACKSGDGDFKKATDGVEYKIISEGKGETLKLGQFIEFHAKTMITRNGKDSVLSDSRETGAVQILQYDSTALPPVYYKIFSELRKGDSMVTRVLTDSVFKKEPMLMPAFMKKGDLLVTSLRVTNIYKTRQEAEDARRASFEAQAAAAKVKAAQVLKEDQQKLLEYFEKNKINAVKTPEGAFVEFVQKGNGALPDTSNFVTVNYTGKLLDGKIFDSNTDLSKGPQEPLLVNLTNEPALGNNVINGLKDALFMMNQGTKAKVYIPSSLGYGPQAAGADIPANSILVFDIDVLQVLNKEQAKAERAKADKKMDELRKKYNDSVAAMTKQAPAAAPQPK